MADPYKIFGAELSPYSVKVRSYFRYKQIPHTWLVRNADNMAEFQKHAKLPLIPLVITPGGVGMQDSTPLIEALEAEHPEPAIHPDHPVLAFVSALVEEFGDEWGNKWMFHYRWWRDVDQVSAAERLADALTGGAANAAARSEAAKKVRERMVGRLHFVGSSEQTRELIETSFQDAVALLDTHLSSRDFLFGARPAFGDFGLWGQLYCAWTDPTAGGILRDRTPHVVAWIERMLDPKATGGWEDWPALAPTLAPLLQRQVAALFLPWTNANAVALEAGQDHVEVDLPSGTWIQGVQKYHARSLAALKARYAAAADNAELNETLEAVDCLHWLR